MILIYLPLLSTSQCHFNNLSCFPFALFQVAALKQWLQPARSARWQLVATSIKAIASLHDWTAAFLPTTSAGSALVVADALVHALVPGALNQFGHAACTTTGVTLVLRDENKTIQEY